MADEQQHELGPVVACHEAFAVVKSYDGNAPDTGDLVVCATEALAEEFAAWAQENDPHGDADDEGDEEESEEGGDEYGWPMSDGSEWCSRYETRKTVAKASEIARTLSQAKEQFAD